MQNIERVVSTESTSPNEDNIDRALRPVRLADYVGQKAVRGDSRSSLPPPSGAASLWTICSSSAPGPGQKLTLAHIVANEMGVNLRQTSGPVLERPGDLAAILTNLEKTTCSLSMKFIV